MPLFGLPYDDEEEERKRRMLTPPPSLPDLGPPARPTPAPGGIPGGIMPPYRPPARSRAEQLEEERHVYQAGTPTRGRSALRGAFEGLASGGLGGAITGAIYGAADPAGLRRRRFEREEKPRLFEQFAMEDQEAERQRREQTFGLDTELRRAQIGAANRSNMPAPRQPSFGSAQGLGIYNQQTGQVTTPAPPPQPRQPTPHYVFDTDGKPYDLDIPEERKRFESLPRGKRVKPEKTASRGAKKAPKVATIEDIDAAVEASGLSELEVKKRFIEKGYRIVEK